MHQLSRLCTLTLAAVALGTAPATAHDGYPWSTPTTLSGPATTTATTQDLCPPVPAESDGQARGTDSSRGAVGASLTAAGSSGSGSYSAACGTLTAAEAGAVPEAPSDAGGGPAVRSGNIAVLLVAGMGALAVTGSAVVAHRRNSGAR